MTFRAANVEPRWILVFVFFLSGLFAGGLGTYLYTQSSFPTARRIHAPNSTYQYINPVIATEPINDFSTNSSTVNKDLDIKIKGLIEDFKSKNAAGDVSVYFRDFEAGKWLASNANMRFSPGILLKMPIMIAYYKLAQHDPALLNDKIYFDGTVINEEDIFRTGTPKLTPGRSYTANQLIVKMIRDSDETAAGLLFDHIDKNVLNEVFSDLGIDFNEDKENRDYITLKRYSLFFRALYNGTYLSYEYSEKALGLLAQGEYNSLLEKDLPQSVPFINRVAGRTLTEYGLEQREVYECDLIYYPNHNYLLCVAARGSGLDRIKDLFRNIGSAVYAEMAYLYKQ